MISVQCTTSIIARSVNNLLVVRPDTMAGGMRKLTQTVLEQTNIKDDFLSCRSIVRPVIQIMHFSNKTVL